MNGENMNFLDKLIFSNFDLMFMAQDANGLMNKIAGMFDGLQGGGHKILLSLGALMLIAAGVAWMAGRQGAQWAKATLARVCLGVGLGTLALDIIGSLVSLFK